MPPWPSRRASRNLSPRQPRESSALRPRRRGQGVVAGDRVVLAGTGSVAFAVAYLAILRAGAVAVLAGGGATDRELGQLIMDSGAAAAFAGGKVGERLAGLARRGVIGRLTSLDAGDPGGALERALSSSTYLPAPPCSATRPARPVPRRAPRSHIRICSRPSAGS